MSEAECLEAVQSLLPEGQSQGRVAKFLQSQSEKLGSRVLCGVAQRMESDPFVKVKKMIKDLITKLMEEAAAESEHKGW